MPPSGLLVARHRRQHDHRLPRVNQRRGVQNDVLVDAEIDAFQGFADECRIRHRLEEVAAGRVEQPELPLMILGQQRVLQGDADDVALPFRHLEAPQLLDPARRRRCRIRRPAG